MVKGIKMEKFDQKIKDKISSFKYNQDPGENLMSGMFEQLERKQIKNTPTIELIPEKADLKSYNILFRTAAAFALLITVGFIIYRVNEVNLYASKGSKLSHQLPDESVVEINADSKIDYNKLLWWVNRGVSLEGEAFFKVKKGEKFTVSSRLGSTQVLGTSFNIYSRGEDYKVECIDGSVKVIYIGGKDEITLSAGKGAQFVNSKEDRIYEFNIDDRKDWRDGEFYFNNESLNKVFKALSRQYNIYLKFSKDIDNIKYTGYFNDRNLENALTLICDPFDLSYQISDGYVVIE
jgi:ferric-dicitrate binding protein FerR (iron transport regulator)